MANATTGGVSCTCRAFGLVALGALAFGCAQPKMAVPPNIEKSSDVLLAQDRSSASGALVDEGFRLGPYPVSDVDRDWNSKSGFSVGPFSDKKATTGYQYQLGAGKTKLKGICGSETKEKSILTGASSAIAWGSTTVACTCDGGSAPASLTWSGDKSEITVAGTTYSVKPVHETAEGSSMSEPVGFSAGDKETLGAVEVTHPGRVWLNKALSDDAKAEASCLFVGLMLYQPPRED